MASLYHSLYHACKPETNVNVLQTFIKQTFKCELKCEKLATRFDSYASVAALDPIILIKGPPI